MHQYNMFWKGLSIFRGVEIIADEKWKKMALLSKWVVNLSTRELPLEAWPEGRQELQQLQERE